MSWWNVFGGAEEQPKPGEGEESAESAVPEEDGEGETTPGQAADASESDGGLFSWIGQGLAKTADLLNTDIRDLFQREGRLVNDEFLTELYAILIRTDMGPAAAREIRDQIGQDFRARVVHMGDVLRVIKEKFRELLAQPETPIDFAAEGPTVIMVVGVNGSGKTTSIAKVANYLVKEGKQVVLGAADTFRAAAVEQLRIWSERIGCEFVGGEHGADPASVAHRAVATTLASGADVCILDTAGRLQTQANLMKELEKIKRVASKQAPGAPHETFLVLDATAGQNAISQAKGFSEAVHCTGIILAKLDGTAKGGVVIPIRQQFDLPVKFVGVGEKPGDLARFDSDAFAEALFREAAAESSE